MKIRRDSTRQQKRWGNNNDGFNRKTALITGASRGIGKAIALKLAGQGANIAIPYLGDPAEAEQAQKEIEALGVKCVMYVCDVSSFEASKEVVEKVIEEFGGVDILVNTPASYGIS